VHRYNHNLETARSHFPNVVTTHTWEERWSTLEMVRDAGMEVCCGGILGMGETLEQRAEFAAQLASLEPDEVPLNFLNPRPGTPFGDLPVMAANDALRAIAAFRLALPARSCASPAAARSRSATWPATACSAASTPSSSATT
jgi:biotin synthase